MTTFLSGLLVAGPLSGATAFAQQKNGGGRPSAAPPVGPARPFKLPPVQERTLANGLRVLFIENHSEPVVSMSVMIKSGAAAEPGERAGLAQMTAGLLDTGTATRTATQLAETIDSAGGSLSASAGWDATFASSTVLANRTELAADLLSDILLRPAFKADEIDRLRSQTLNSLQVSASNAGFVASQVFDKVVFGASPYAHPIGGTPTTIASLTRDEIAAFHKAQYIPNNATLAIVGDLTPQAAFATAEKYFGSWAKGAPAAQVAQAPAAATSGKLRIIILDKPDAVQTEVRAGIGGIARADKEYFAAVVANAILGGAPFSSRVEQELRVKRGLTYGANSRFDARQLGGTFAVTTSTKTESTGEAVQVIIEEINRLRTGDVPAEELKSRRDFLAGTFALSLETPDAVASRLLTAELYGLGADYLDTYTTRINSITSADVRRVVESRIRPDQFVIVLAGNAAGFEEKIRELGPVEKIPFDEVDASSESLRRVRAAAAAPASAGDAQAGTALANRAIDALGGDAWVNQKSVVLKGTGSLTPAPGQKFELKDVAEYRVYPNQSRMDMNVAGMATIRRGYNGTVGWAEQPGAGLVDATKQFKQSESFGIGALRKFRAGGMTARLVADAEVEGKTVKGFAIADAAGNETTVYVDPTTALPVRMVYAGPQGEVSAVFKDYRDVQGVKIPFTIEQAIGPGATLVVTYAEANVNVPVDASLFEKPAN